MRSGSIVVGIGHPDRGDDAVGLIVADKLRDLVPNDVTVLCEDGEGGSLLDRLSEAERTIVIDAALSGAPAGTVKRFDAVTEALPPARYGMSTHGFGLADAIELGRVLGRLPERCIVFAIEAESFAIGEPLSPTVAIAADEVVARVLAEVSGEG
jgi:hydrogenase maturation protease